MARLKRRENLIPFVLFFGLGFMAVGVIPPMFADQIIEVPAFVVIPAEIAVALIMSVLLFENSSPAELVRISLMMIGFIMAIGTFGNVMTRTTQGMPDGTFLLNWVQLAIMNVGGILSTVGYYSTKPQERQTVIDEDEIEEPVLTKEERARIKAEAAEEESESAAEILAKLDPKRFEAIEKGGGGKLAGGMISNAALSKPRALTPEELADALETEAELELKLEEDESKLLPEHKVSPFDAMLEEAVSDSGEGAASPAEPKKEGGGGLFSISDDDVGGLFDNIVADPSVTKDAMGAKPGGEPAAATPSPIAEKKEGGLFSVSDDDIGGIFDNLVADPSVTKDDVKEGVKPAAAATTAAPAKAEPAAADKKNKKGKEVKDFGRLSATASNKPPEGPTGTLKTIGQMLLDTQAVEGMIKSAEGRDPSTTTAKVVSVDRGADIQALLNKIASYPGANGSLVIGKDGLLVGATESLGFMKDVLGPLSLAMQSTTKLGTTKLDIGELQQIVFKSGEKLTVLTEVGMGVLAVFSDAYNQSSIDGLLEWIQATVAESGSMGEAPTAELGSIFSAKPDAQVPPVGAPVKEEKEVAKEEPKEEEKPAAPAPAPKAEPAPQKGGLFNVSDDEIGGLFDNIVADPTVTKDSVGGGGKESAAKEGMDFSPQEKKEATAADAGKSSADAGKAAADAGKAAADAGKAAADAGKAAAEPVDAKKASSNVKEFGRLAPGTASSPQNQEVGTIKSIGRQLIDVQAVENIIKSGEKKGEKIGSGLTTARVISSARGEGIKMLLQKIDTAPGVAGSLIVGNDGLVIASTLGSNMDKDTLGVLCTAMHSHTELAAKKLEMGKLRQIIFHADDKLTVLTAVAVGVLAVFVEHHDVAKIDDLLMAIEQTVRG